jgi:tRNA (guanine-N7-)-methyltransferase
MKPKNLKFPFDWESRAPLFADGVLYVPKYYALHEDWPKEELWKELSVYPKVAIEYCSGNGTWIAERAKQDLSTLWIAVEKRFDRTRKIWSKKHNFFLKNLLIVCGEALTFTKHYLPDQCIDSIYVNFPDPWPKSRHAKNRLIQKPFIEEISRISKDLAEATFVTDDAPYSLQMIEEMQKGKWNSSLPDPFYQTYWSEYGESYFDSLWREKKREIRYLQFTNHQQVPSFI